MPQRPGTEPPKRQSALVFATVQQLRQEPAPLTSERYAFVLEIGKTFAWNLYGSDDHNGITVIAPQSGGPGTGRWEVARSDDRGVDLTDDNAVILVSERRTRVLPAETLTANRVLTLGTTGAEVGDELHVVRNDVEAFTLTIVNGGTGAGNVAVMPVSTRAWCLARFDGTNWIHLGSGLSLSAS